ncbi:MAG: hypothetical protein HYW05_04875 [Candidatus Diapherotrites archaeon]|nr:hypothetical protein [Candidatus Diapherotrites archaeon]
MDKADVELIPWVHNFDTSAHEDVVNYVRGLPKNSHLATEITPERLSYYNRLLSVITGSVRKILPDVLAALEIMHECKKRNITIIPLETPVSREIIIKTYENKSSRYSTELANKFRDQTFARILETTLKKFKGQKLPVLLGLQHVALGEILNELRKRGINARVNTTIFTYKKEILEKINRQKRLIARIMRGERVRDVTYYKRRKMDPEIAKTILINELWKKKETSTKRTLRRLKERKMTLQIKMRK